MIKRSYSDEIRFVDSMGLSIQFEPLHDKTNKISVRPAKTQISLGIRPAWSESSLCVQWVAKGPRFLHADSEDSDQTGRMPRLIWVFAGCTLTLLVLSCRGSFVRWYGVTKEVYNYFLVWKQRAENCWKFVRQEIDGPCRLWFQNLKFIFIAIFSDNTHDWSDFIMQFKFFSLQSDRN